jgi:hypothetical protein
VLKCQRQQQFPQQVVPKKLAVIFCGQPPQWRHRWWFLRVLVDVVVSRRRPNG